MSNLVTKPIEELAPLIRNKQISPVELTNDFLERIEKYDKHINAFIHVRKEQAKIEAMNAEQEITNGLYRGVLHGIPMALKDNFYLKDEVVTVGSKIDGNFIPNFNATVVNKLKDAGVIFTGKLNMHEYAVGVTNFNPHYGSCLNPWNLKKVPGGSSGGSGAAISADMTTASLGTDTGGSVRIPASNCGIIGLKPTYGRVSNYGCYPLAWSQDHVGPMAKTVRDTAYILENVSGYDINDPSSLNVPKDSYIKFLTGNMNEMVIGIENYFFKDLQPEVEKLVRKGIQTLCDMGAKVQKVKIPTLQHLDSAHYDTLTSEAGTIHQKEIDTKINEFGEDVQRVLKKGRTHSAFDYLQAQQIKRQLKVDFRKAYQQVHVIIAPTLPFIAPTVGEDDVNLNGRDVSVLEHSIRFTSPGNLTGNPVISIPCGLSDGIPVGMQIYGPDFSEGMLLNVAYAFERTNPLGKMRAEEFVKECDGGI